MVSSTPTSNNTYLEKPRVNSSAFMKDLINKMEKNYKSA